MSIEVVFNFLVNMIEPKAGRPLTDEEKEAILHGLQSEQHFFGDVEKRLSQINKGS